MRPGSEDGCGRWVGVSQRSRSERRQCPQRNGWRCRPAHFRRGARAISRRSCCRRGERSAAREAREPWEAFFLQRFNTQIPTEHEITHFHSVPLHSTSLHFAPLHSTHSAARLPPCFMMPRGPHVAGLTIKVLTCPLKRGACVGCSLLAVERRVRDDELLGSLVWAL